MQATWGRSAPLPHDTPLRAARMQPAPRRKWSFPSDWHWCGCSWSAVSSSGLPSTCLDRDVREWVQQRPLTWREDRAQDTGDRRRGWGSWASSAWRREGSRETSLLSVTVWYREEKTERDSCSPNSANEDGQTQVAQRVCAISILRGFQDSARHVPEQLVLFRPPLSRGLD